MESKGCIKVEVPRVVGLEGLEENLLCPDYLSTTLPAAGGQSCRTNLKLKTVGAESTY